jgi:hypothetical protein
MIAALYTFGVFRERADHPANQGFHDRNDPILSIVSEAPGFIARAGYEDEEDGPPEWGPQVWPRWYVERGDGWSPATLSLWRDLESIAAFAYTGLHGEAVRLGREWFQLGTWPPLVIWWTEPDSAPTWAEAVSRFHALADNGPTRYAFNLRAPFSTEGRPFALDPLRLSEYRAITSRLV